MEADQAAQVLQRWQLLDAATEQLNARRGAKLALAEAQNRIAQLDRALQQSARPMGSVGHVVDTRVLGRPHKWDGSETAWPTLELRDESSPESHRPAAVDRHDKCRDQYGCVEQRKHDANQEIQECAVVRTCWSNEGMTPTKKSRSVQL